MAFLKEFNEKYAKLLNARTESFRILFTLMEEKAAKGQALKIIETGCLRLAGNWSGDGQSSYLFDRFIHNYSNCKLDIYDISPASIEAARKAVNHKNTTLHTQDSVEGLWKYTDPVDVLYLDSFDVDFNNTHPSAFHHVKELCAIMKNITPGALIMVDDNINNKGKGQYIYEFMKNIGAEILYDGYQVLFRLPSFTVKQPKLL